MIQTGSGTGGMRAYFDRCAGTWDENCRHDPSKIAAIVTLAGVKPGCRIADIACGTGILFPEILSRNPELLLGVDFSEKMIEKARSKFSDPRLRLAASDFFDVNEGGFDVVLLYSAYPHFPDKKSLSEHLSSLLKPGGRLMVAHSESREAINGRHSGAAVRNFSWELRGVQEESEKFAGEFTIDMTADTKEIYFFSGIKK